MARIVISSAGTLGDFVPFVALGQKLRDRGHDVLMAVNPAMLPLAQRAGLEAAACGCAFGAEEARQHAKVFDHWTPWSEEETRNAWPLLDVECSYRDLAGACRGADLLIASSLQAVAPMVHENQGIRWVTVSLLPEQFRHADDARAPLTVKDKQLWGEWHDFKNQLRARLGFPKLQAGAWRRYAWSDRLILLASSPHFSQPLLGNRPEVRMTGFWFADQPSRAWEAEAEMEWFLDVEPRPLVLTFSSLPVNDPGRVMAVHVEAAERLGRRLLIQQGWADLGSRHRTGQGNSSQVFWAGHVPHAWLFPRAAAVIHHGGVGTTAQALRCGCPMVVEPYGNDQFFNARRALALGVGAAMHPHKLTAEGLARVLAEKVLTPPVRSRAADLSLKLRTEDGLSVACDLIGQQLCSG